MTLLAVVFSPVFYFLIWRRKKFINRRGWLRILITPQFTRVGDLVCATPVFRAIKQQYPHCFLAVLATNKNAGIIKNNPNVDEIIIYKSIDLWGTIKRVNSLNFDWSFNLAATSLGTVLSYTGLIPNRAKIIRAGRPLTEIITDWLNNFGLLYKHHTYLPRYYLDLLKFMGITESEEVKEVFTAQEGDKRVGGFLGSNGVDGEEILVGISITAGNKIKEWGGRKFAELARKISEKYGAKIIFLGGKKDESRIDEIIKNFDNRNYLKAVDFSLEELPSLMKKFSLYIGVDTGPVYIAHALKIPLIDIVGPVDSAEQPPEDDLSILVRPPADIKPSSFVLKKAGKPEEHKRALEAIWVEDVLAAVDEILSR